MNTYIIIADVAESEIDRTDLQNIEEKEFKTLEELQQALKTTDFEIYTLSDFMDLWNNEEVTPERNWLGYVKIEEDI